MIIDSSMQIQSVHSDMRYSTDDDVTFCYSSNEPINEAPLHGMRLSIWSQFPSSITHTAMYPGY